MIARRTCLKPIVVTLLALVSQIGSMVWVQSAAAQSTNPLEFILIPSKRLFLPDEREAVMMLEISGARDVGQTRAPVAMAIVIDTSGSMDGQKIVDARSAAHALIDRLSQGDVLSIVTYADSALIVLANYLVGSDRTMAHQTIERIVATGSTCMSCGLERGYGLLSDVSPTYTRRVIMLSDGNANRGYSDAHSLRTMASAALESYAVPTSTIGLGYDYNEDLMVAVANGGAGAYYFLPNGDAIATVLDREFSELNRMVAGNLVIEMTPVNGATFVTPQIPGVVRDGNRLILNLGQISAGSQRQILVPVTLPSGDLGQVISARATFLDASGDSYELEQEVNLSRSSDSNAVEESQEARVVTRVEQQNSARVVATALEAYQRGDRQGALQQLQQNAARLQEGASTLAAPALAEEAREMEQLYEFLEEEEPSEENVDGLRRHNRARSIDRDRGMMDEEMYHDSMMY